MKRAVNHIAIIELDDHESVELSLEWEGDRYASYLCINGVDCELQYLPVDLAKGLLHADPASATSSDNKGFTYLLVPFTR